MTTMGFMDIFKVKEYKEKVSSLTTELERISSVMTPELKLYN